MSLPRSVEIKCPKCGTVSQFNIWESINVDLDPNLKQEILNGDIFRFKCPECGEVQTLIYGFLYHDMSKRLMIYFTDDRESAEKAIREFKETGAVFGGEDYGYTFRIVNDRNSLVEKIMVFDFGGNDKNLEALKYFQLQELQKEHPEANISKVFFNVYDGDKGQLDFLDDQWRVVAQIPVHIDELTKSFEMLDNDESYVIDQEWIAGICDNKEE